MQFVNLVSKFDELKNGCTGCGACQSSCPLGAVTVQNDENGFLTAFCNVDKCVDCMKCVKVCPQNHELKNGNMDHPDFYGAQSLSENDVKEASSGGIFYELALFILQQGGVVYGAAYNGLNVEHIRVIDADDLKRCRKSKYLGSYMGCQYINIKKDLNEGKSVLFSGVPCQIAGLYAYLDNTPSNLYTCEVVCHGIPSYKAFNKYMEYMQEDLGKKFAGINFRDKRMGWKNNAIAVTFDDGTEKFELSSSHPLHSLYLRGINMRKECGSCHYSQLPRLADISLADYWQSCENELASKREYGISLVAVNNKHGDELFSSIKNNIAYAVVSEKNALESCRHMSHTPILNPKQTIFFKLLEDLDYRTAYGLCNGDFYLKSAEELHQYNCIDLNKIFEIFWNNRYEIIYFCESGLLKGILTFGDFLVNSSDAEAAINTSFKKVIYSNGCDVKIKEIFDANNRISRIPVLNEDKKLLYEIRKDGVYEKEYIPSRNFMEFATYYEAQTNQRKLILVESVSEAISLSDQAFVRLVSKKSRTQLLSTLRSISCQYTREYEKELLCRYMYIYIGHKLSKMNCRFIFVKRPDIKADFDYSTLEKRRIQEQISFLKMSESPTMYADDWQEVLGSKYSEAYIGGLREIPPLIYKNGHYMHMDKVSDYINVANGCRKTLYQPKQCKMYVQVYGRCGAFGYAVEDGETLPSFLQKALQKSSLKDVKVVNRGLWGADDEKIIHNLLWDIENGVINENDIVLIYMDYPNDIKPESQHYVELYDSTEYFHQSKLQTASFYDKPGHMTAEGYKLIAEYIMGIIKQKAKRVNEKIDKKADKLFEKIIHISYEDWQMQYLDKYLGEVKQNMPIVGGKIGAIVMNCNPFTKGHRYLIEKASECVDWLLVFVVEEDKSIFPFDDRMQMVREGISDIKNAQAFPSGKYMISAFTFPEYFVKEQQKDVTINPALDLELFGQYVAPTLGITIRFVGTEPIDNITHQYNEKMKDILPKFGVSICEIDRLCGKDGIPVSASEVRQAMNDSDMEKLHSLLPESSYNFLIRKGYLKHG